MKTPAVKHSSWALIGAIAVVAFAIANVMHEGAHGVACVLAGGKPIAFSAIHFDCDEAAIDEKAGKWISAAGTLANLFLAAASLGALRLLKKTATADRFFWWLFMTVNALQAGGYWLFSGLARIGDWAHVIDGWAPHWAWRIGLTGCGLAVYLTAIRVSLKELGLFLVHNSTLKQQARRLTLTPYFAGGALYVAAGVFNPVSVKLILISAAAASFGGTSALAWMFNLYQSRRWASHATAAAEFQPALSWSWGLSATIAAGIFVGVLGPGLFFLS